MKDQRLKADAIADPDLTEYIDQMVERKVAEKVDKIKEQLEISCAPTGTKRTQVSNRATIVVFSGDLDKQIAAFVIASGAAAMGMDVSMYFTFWGLSALKTKTSLKGKNISEKLLVQY